MRIHIKYKIPNHLPINDTILGYSEGVISLPLTDNGEELGREIVSLLSFNAKILSVETVTERNSDG